MQKAASVVFFQFICMWKVLMKNRQNFTQQGSVFKVKMSVVRKIFEQRKKTVVVMCRRYNAPTQGSDMGDLFYWLIRVFSLYQGSITFCLLFCTSIVRWFSLGLLSSIHIQEEKMWQARKHYVLFPFIPYSDRLQFAYLFGFHGSFLLHNIIFDFCCPNSTESFLFVRNW